MIGISVAHCQMTNGILQVVRLTGIYTIYQGIHINSSNWSECTHVHQNNRGGRKRLLTTTAAPAAAAAAAAATAAAATVASSHLKNQQHRPPTARTCRGFAANVFENIERIEILPTKNAEKQGPH